MKNKTLAGILGAGVSLSSLVGCAATPKPTITTGCPGAWINCRYEDESSMMVIHAFDSDGIDKIEVYDDFGKILRPYTIQEDSKTEKKFQAIALLRISIINDRIYNVKLTDKKGNTLEERYEKK